MAWATPRRWHINDGTPTHDWLNQDLITNPDTLYNCNDAQVRAYRSSSQSIPNNTRQTITWTNTVYEITGGLWDGGTPTRLVAPFSGIYLLTARTPWASNSTGRRGVGYRIQNPSDGLDYDMQMNAANSTSKQNGADLIKLRAGQYLDVYGYQSSGAALNLASFDEGDATATLQLLAVPNAAPPWTPPRDWLDGDIATPHLLTSQFYDNLQNLRSFMGHAAKVSLKDNQSITGGERTPLSWDIEQWKIGSLWTGGSKFTATIPGWFLIIPTIEWRSESTAAVGALRGVGFTDNKTNRDYDLHFQSGSQSGVSSNGKAIHFIDEGESIEIYAYHDAEQSLTINGSIDRTRCAIGLIAA